MGIQQGSLSLCRYRLLGGTGRESITSLTNLMESYKVGPLSLEGNGREESYGWVRPLGVDNVDWPPAAHWDMSHCVVDDGFLLRLRIERRKVPVQLMQLIYKQRYFEIVEREGKPPRPKERQEIKEQLKSDLLVRALPSVSHVDAYWRDGEGELMLFSTGKKVRDLFESLFQATFAGPLNLTLVRMDPPLMGLSKDQWEDSVVASETLGRLSLTAPMAFAEQVYP